MDFFSFKYRWNKFVDGGCRANRGGEKIGFSRKQKLVEKVRWVDLPGQTRCILQSTNAQPTRLVCHIKGADVSRARTNTTVFPFDLRAPPRCLQCRQITHGGISSFFSILPFSPETTYFCGLVNVIFFFLSFFRLSETALRQVFLIYFLNLKKERKSLESRIISRQRNTCN